MTTADYGQRAAFALNRCVPPRHGDKAVASALKVSVRMARYLRAGAYWTTDRLNQASATWKQFDTYLAAPDRLHAHLDALEGELATIRSMLEAGGMLGDGQQGNERTFMDAMAGRHSAGAGFLSTGAGLGGVGRDRS